MNAKFGQEQVKSPKHKKRLYLTRGGCFLKKKARSPTTRGFGQDFYVVLKFVEQQYSLNTVKESSCGILMINSV